MANGIKGFLSNPIASYTAARQPGGFLAPTENFQGFLSDPRTSIGIQIAQGVPIGQALLGGALQAKQIEDVMFPEAEERKIIVDANGRQRYLDTGEFVFPDLEVKEDKTSDYKNYLKTVPVGQEPNAESFQQYLLQKATAGATRIDLSEKAQAQIGVEFAKTQLKEVGNDLEKTANWLDESRAIGKMAEGIENFQTGALGNVRATIGSFLAFLNTDYQNNPEKMTDLLNPSGAELTESGAATFQRELARGLQNLNVEEVKINKRITPSLTKEPYVNKVILETLKIDNNAKKQLDELANEFLAQNITYKEYIAQKREIKDTATNQANVVFDTITKVATEIPKILKQEIGATVQAMNVNNQVVSIKVQATDKFTGQSDMSGNPIIQTINGELYALVIKPIADED